MKLIGISAHAARSGKDTLAQCLQIILSERGKTVEIRSLASPLKEKMKGFIMDEFGIDVFNCSDEEKKIIRPLLVAYGGARRKQTQGKYWTNLMESEIALLEKKNIDFCIIPDIRYSEFPGDECEWIKNKGGALFFVSMILENGNLLPPPNEDEERNSPLLKGAADIEISWEHMKFEDCLFFVKNTLHVYDKFL
jgi:hypothetical protein